MAQKSNGNGGGAIGFEAALWSAAEKLKGNMDAAEYKHVVLGLIFLKYISDAFEEKHAALAKDKTADPEDRDEYTADNIFWVNKIARWSYLQGRAKQPTIGKDLDDAMVAVEKDNPTLKSVLPKEYARPALDKHRLGELIDLVGTIGLGDKESRSKDILGRVYEYFLSQFASAEGRQSGQFYTPRHVVRLLIEMLAPYKGRVFDPCCGSGGMFVQSEKFVEAHGGRIGDISIYGQESNYTTWRLAMMNMAIRGIEAHIAWNEQGSFHNDAFKDLKADYILANPPFNDDDWGGNRLREDVRWKFGVPPIGNANFAWVQHFIHHLSPTGTAGFVLANGSMSSMQSGEGEIRQAIVEADLVDCMVALPGQLFYSTQIPVCLWFLARDKRERVVKIADSPLPECLRDRCKQTLFIDARKMGTLVDRVHRELSEADIQRIAETYHNWKRDDELLGKEAIKRNIVLELSLPYCNIPGFCKSVTLKEIASHGHVLTPGRYVGAEEAEDDGEAFEQKMERLTAKLEEQFVKSAKLEKAIRMNLAGLSVQKH
ncbi:MAG TPA: class I SAM-dependent DNA methyltransferase [Verrucomicrobiae bacterium]|nr:class I SAM-dependent DNA methyltransferase [Verrucomicrobiae bacterium]